MYTMIKFTPLKGEITMLYSAFENRKYNIEKNYLFESSLNLVFEVSGTVGLLTSPAAFLRTLFGDTANFAIKPCTFTGDEASSVDAENFTLFSFSPRDLFVGDD